MFRKYLEIWIKECELAALILIGGIQKSAFWHLAFEIAELKMPYHQLCSFWS